MILTVTTNPSIDRTYHCGAVRLGEVNRASADGTEASGKGVNISRVLHAAGVATMAVLTTAGAEGAQLCDALRGEGIRFDAVGVSGVTRTNISLLEPDGRTTKINGAGTPLAGPDAAALAHAVRTLAGTARWVVCSGSLPPDTDPGLVAEFVHAARAAGAPVAVDTSGPALDAALHAHPDVLAPNGSELATLTGRTVRTAGDAHRAAAGVAAVTGGALLVSLGAEGALYVCRDGAWHAVPPAVRPVNTAGAGDALLAGWLAAPGPVEQRLAQAVAWGTAACLLPGTAGNVAAVARPERVRVARIDVDRGTDGAR